MHKRKIIGQILTTLSISVNVLARKRKISKDFGVIF